MMESGVDFGSDKIHTLRKPRVAVLSGDEASANALGEVWHLFDKELGYPLTLINASGISTATLKDIDVVIAADGQFKLLTEKERALKNWVKNGGRLVALENSVMQLASGDWNVKMRKDPESDAKDCTVADLIRYEDRERSSVSSNTPGAIYRITLDESHPMAFGYQDFFFLLKMNSNLMQLNKDVWNVATLNEALPVSGFVGAEAKTKLNNGSVMTVQEFGNGTLVCVTDDIIFRDFWENGKLLFLNTVFMYAH
jgi:hypothetical protein